MVRHLKSIISEIESSNAKPSQRQPQEELRQDTQPKKDYKTEVQKIVDQFNKDVNDIQDQWEVSLNQNEQMVSLAKQMELMMHKIRNPFSTTIKQQVESAHNDFIDGEVQKIQDHINTRRINFEEEMAQFCTKLQGLFDDHKQYLSDYKFQEQYVESRDVDFRLCSINRLQYEID